jgi:hypothetical protein
MIEWELLPRRWRMVLLPYSRELLQKALKHLIRSRLRLSKAGDQLAVPLVHRVHFLLLCPVVSCKARIRSAEIGNFLLQSTNIALNLQVFLFSIANAPAEFVDRRNDCIGTKQIESPPSRQKFLKVKLGTKSPRTINVADINFSRFPSSAQRIQQKLAIRPSLPLRILFLRVYLDGLGRTAFADVKDPLRRRGRMRRT